MRGKVHKYLNMTFDLYDLKKVHIYMINYMNALVNNFSIKLNPKYTSSEPETGNLLAVVDSEDPSKYKA